MTEKDMVVGEFYHCTESHDRTYWVSKLIEFGKSNNFNNSPYYSNMNGNFEFQVSCPSYSGRVVRLATPQEKEHLQQCIAAGKYVDYVKSKLSFNYLIL